MFAGLMVVPRREAPLGAVLASLLFPLLAPNPKKNKPQEKIVEAVLTWSTLHVPLPLRALHAPLLLPITIVKIGRRNRRLAVHRRCRALRVCPSTTISTKTWPSMSRVKFDLLNMPETLVVEVDTLKLRVTMAVVIVCCMSTTARRTTTCSSSW